MSTAAISNMGTAVVTGASSGIGRIYTDRLARRGYDLLLVARRADRLEALAKELQDRDGIRARTLVADLGETAELEKVAQVIGTDPSVNLLVNNAGTNTVGPLTSLKKENLQGIINVNVMALARLTVAVLPGFTERDRGTVINIGSVLGFTGYPYLAAYSGTKSFVMNFTRSLQQELAGTKIKVQLVTPAATATEIWEVQGYPLSSVDPKIVMTAEDCVDASLQGLELGEATTVPSVDDLNLLASFDAASAALFAGAQLTGKPAARYGRVQG